MKCKCCGDYFYIKRSLLELFKQHDEILCNNCYKSYPLNINIENILLDQYSCKIIALFKEDYKINYNFFINEYNKIFKANMNREGYHTLFFDYVKLDDYSLEVLDIISKIFQKNLLIITFFLKK
ncbi:MAG: hypothetical protein IJY14_01060 [Acholeplasmatales bacterium]|nr:hypothetical protein [Acholeplasmatales bacterium]